jgi:hypothetical protein
MESFWSNMEGSLGHSWNGEGLANIARLENQQGKECALKVTPSCVHGISKHWTSFKTDSEVANFLV